MTTYCVLCNLVCQPFPLPVNCGRTYSSSLFVVLPLKHPALRGKVYGEHGVTALWSCWNLFLDCENGCECKPWLCVALDRLLCSVVVRHHISYALLRLWVSHSSPLPLPTRTLFDSSPVGRDEQTGNVLDAYWLASSVNTALPAGWLREETGNYEIVGYGLTDWKRL